MTEELTAPVQKNFYAVGHKYSLLWGDSKKLATYMGTHVLTDKNIWHVFVWEDKLIKPAGDLNNFSMTHSLHDSYVDDYISDLEE